MEKIATPKEVVKEQLSPEREKLEIQLKELEIDCKRQELNAHIKMDEQEIEKRDLEIEDLKKQGSGFQTPIDQLLAVARACCIDNDKTGILSTEPVVKSLWTDDEMYDIKKLIMSKAKKL